MQYRKNTTVRGDRHRKISKRLDVKLEILQNHTTIGYSIGIFIGFARPQSFVLKDFIEFFYRNLIL
jgi:hypothetical protein